MNCTYEVREPGCCAYEQGMTTLVDAVVSRAQARSAGQTRAQIYAVWGNGTRTDVDEADVSDALDEQLAQLAATAR